MSNTRRGVARLATLAALATSSLGCAPPPAPELPLAAPLPSAASSAEPLGLASGGPPTRASASERAHDSDGDGLSDVDDRCPDAAEDRDGFEDDDGCPEPDNDGDGILDLNDRCPNNAEDRDGFEDEDGCPDPDNDKDGLLDTQDRCPNEPGPPSNGGCPALRARP